MPKSKLTLIIDGNWLMMSRLPVLNGRYADDKTLIQEVKLLMIKSINVVLRTFPMVDNIMFVSDGGSWRKDEPIPSYMKDDTGSDIEYKGNRIQSDEFDWDMIFAEFNNFIEELKTNGVSAFHENGIEGDDWCWYWSRKLNEQGTNVIIWTKDRDITQLVSSDKNGCFTVVWNKDNGVFMKEDNNLTNFLLNPFFQRNESILNEVISHAVKKNIVVPEKVQIDKIIRGDKGDNVMPILTKRAKNGSGKVFRVTEKHLPESLDIYNMNEVKNWLNKLMSSKSYAGKVIEPVEQILDHFEYNRKMVVLDKSSYPKSVLDVFAKYDNWMDDHDLCVNIDKAEATITAQKNNLTSILDEI